jgi:hypothetical protein
MATATLPPCDPWPSASDGEVGGLAIATGMGAPVSCASADGDESCGVADGYASTTLTQSGQCRSASGCSGDLVLELDTAAATSPPLPPSSIGDVSMAYADTWSRLRSSSILDATGANRASASASQSSVATSSETSSSCPSVSVPMARAWSSSSSDEVLVEPTSVPRWSSTDGRRAASDGPAAAAAGSATACPSSMAMYRSSHAMDAR